MREPQTPMWVRRAVLAVTVPLLAVLVLPAGPASAAP
jgi:hypothetical protein